MSYSTTRWTCDACGCCTNSVEDHALSCSICGSARPTSGFGVAAELPASSTTTTTSQQPLVDATVLMETALANKELYQPVWYDPSEDDDDDSSTNRKACSSIRVANAPKASKEPSFSNVCYLPAGSSPEGQSIRAAKPLSRSSPTGFKMVYHRPFRSKTKPLGGGYLVGVVQAPPFGSWKERNSLPHSCWFWGLDDAGHLYESVAGGDGVDDDEGMDASEGSASTSTNNPHRRVVHERSSKPFFGSHETITCVVDWDTLSLTFWKNGDENLGTLVRQLPQEGDLYPVAVPFNSGAIALIASLDQDPLEQLKRYEAHADQEMVEQERATKLRLEQERQLYMKLENGRPTELLLEVLEAIFGLYATNASTSRSATDGETTKTLDVNRTTSPDDSTTDIHHNKTLTVTAAAQLWYRCGLKLSHGQQLLQQRASTRLLADVEITYEDFKAVLVPLLEEDAGFKLEGRRGGQFEVGDIVELVEGYEGHGDASRGPMVSGDRGQVIDMQQGGNGDRPSTRVLFNGRRWWYQPQTLISEKSGLIATPGVWFLQRILRAHGYDHTTLQPTWGKPLTKTSWQVGDLVVPATDATDPQDATKNQNLAKVTGTCWGRIVAPCSLSGSNSILSRESGMVCVECVDSTFCLRIGVPQSSDSRIHRVSIQKLAHAGMAQFLPADTNSATADSVPHEGPSKDVLAIARLSVQAIESVAKECEASPGALARFFNCGLSTSIFEALDLGLMILEGGTTDDSNLLPALTALGNLLVLMAKQIFPQEEEEAANEKEAADEKKDSSEKPMLEHDDEELPDAPAIQVEDLLPTNVAPAAAAAAPRFQTRNAATAAEELPPLPSSRARLQFIRDWTAANDRQQPPSYDRRLFELAAADSSSPDHAGASTGDFAPSTTATTTKNDTVALKSPLMQSARRGGFESFSPGEDARRGSPVLNAATKSAIANGVLSNNCVWFSRVAESAKKRKGSSSSSAASASLANARDEDSIPLLALAVTLGCSSDIVAKLIADGGVIDKDIITDAAYLGQSEVLAILLSAIVLTDDYIERSKCNPAIIATIEEAAERQRRHQESLQREGEEFLCKVTKKLIQFALSARSIMEPKVQVYRAIGNIFVGRVLLRAVYLNSQRVLSAASLAKTSKSTAADPESGRVAIFEDDKKYDSRVPSKIASFEGFLFAIPNEILSRRFFSKADSKNCDESSFRDYLRLVESLLWSQDVDDIALGLTLTTLFANANQRAEFQSELEGLGLTELVTFHKREAARRLAELGTSTESHLSDTRRFSVHPVDTTGNNGASCILKGVVLCPKCHPAELHLTRHSSFRCDLCGKGVERGFPMHGCRECDWDACEECINKYEGGIVKWQHVKSMTEEYDALFKASKEEADETNNLHLAEKSAKDWSIKLLASRVRGLEVNAFKELSEQLSLPGGITMSQFTNLILPALYHAIVVGGTTSSWDEGCQHAEPPQKKPRSLFPRVPSPKVVTRHDALAAAAKTLILQPILDRVVDSDEEGEDKKATGGNTKLESRDSEGDASELKEKLGQHAPELLRRLHDIITFCEKFPTSADPLIVTKENSSELQSLMKPLVVEVAPLLESKSSASAFDIYVEPLMQLSEMNAHLLRSHASEVPAYVTYCQNLVEDKAIIAERSGHSETTYRVAQVSNFDSESGLHLLKYASKVVSGSRATHGLNLAVDGGNLEFCGEEKYILLLDRDYYILYKEQNEQRDTYKSIVQSVMQSQDIPSSPSRKPFPLSAIPRGTRVESAVGQTDGKRRPYTIVGCISATASEETHFAYDLVSDNGDVLRAVERGCITVDGTENVRVRSLRERLRTSGAQGRILDMRNLIASRSDSDETDRAPPCERAAVLKRTWSALSLLENLSPVDLHGGDNQTAAADRATLKVALNGEEFDAIPATSLDERPELSVRYGLASSSSSIDLPAERTTVYAAFSRLRDESEGQGRSRKQDKLQVFYSIRSSNRTASCRKQKDNMEHTSIAPSPFTVKIMEKSDKSWIDDRDAVALQCMRLIDELGCYIQDSGIVVEMCSDQLKPSKVAEFVEASLVSLSLTRKLSAQLERTLSVVSGALPKWCSAVPSAAPRLFSYSSRRQLIERSAFGISRATFRQQEAKVNVGSWRQRMAALRGRAVELVGEAFSGGAEDPTALQLQADELYTMEEALGARISAAFRAQRWQERSLQCAKAAVRRERLLYDASAFMHHYASDKMIRKRRLEVRFDGESGFDAASGDEAGVTRGFYADVAESLLNCDHVSSNVVTTPSCTPDIAMADANSPLLTDDQPTNVFEIHESKLPLWIPDLDSSCKVVIPTPRASPESSPGVYPRPLAIDDFRMESVKAQFRFMGRMFASAMRDNFMFPLPLSSSFLRLVLMCNQTKSEQPHGKVSKVASRKVARKHQTPPSTPHGLTFDSDDEYENTPTTSAKSTRVAPLDSLTSSDIASGQILSSLDLPRPGFLGGEVSAVEQHILKQLDFIDALNLGADEKEKRYLQIASNRNFAREAFGKSYDCSFKEFFEGKTFVDPLDSSQGVGAATLCSNGHLREVTIFNIREWISLSKQFLLHDGVVEQARAFRQGVNDFFSPEYLRLFTAQELHRDVCGGSDRVDEWTEGDIRQLFKLDGAKGSAEALMAVASIGGEGGATLSRRFASTSPTISYLIKTLLQSNVTQRRQFLSFVTSVPIVTPGKIEVVPTVSPNGEFMPVRDNCLPRANTCARRLYLPKFDSYDSFSTTLWAVIREESKFKGFYEWRGN